MMQPATFAYLLLIFHACVVTKARAGLLVDAARSSTGWSASTFTELQPGDVCTIDADKCGEGSLCQKEQISADYKQASAVCKLKLGSDCRDFPEFCEMSAICEDNVCKVNPGRPCDPKGVECGGESVCTNVSDFYTDEIDTATGHMFWCLLPLGANCTAYPHTCDNGLECDIEKNACVKEVISNPLKLKVVNAMAELGGALATMIDREEKLESDVKDLSAQLQKVTGKLDKDTPNAN